MDFTMLWKTLQAEPVFLALLVVFALFSLLSMVTYFYVVRHSSGSVDWISRRKYGKFEPLIWQLPTLSDVLWLLLSLALSAVLRVVRIFCFLDLYTFSVQSYDDLLVAAFSDTMLPTLALAAACYLLVRTVYGNSLVATLLSLLGAFTHSNHLWATSLIVLSLLFLYIWMTAKPDAPLFFNAFWLVFSAMCYGSALLTCWASIYLAPMYVTAYAVTQYFRWRKGDPEHRFGKLIASLILLTTVVLLGIFLLWLLYYLSEKGKVHVLTILASEELYREMFPTLIQKFRDLFVRPGLRATFLAGDSFLLLLGLSCVLPALRELYKGRRFVMLLGILAFGFFAFMWILGCVYMLMPALLLLIGGVWTVFAQRGYSRYAVFSCLAVLGCYVAELLLR